MLEVEGKYNKAKVFTSVIDEGSMRQIRLLCDQQFTSGSTLRFMSDVHAGIGCVIGTTMTIQDKIVPNLVGVDIGCGMEVVVINKDSPYVKSFSGELMDKVIKESIPSGMNVRRIPHSYIERTHIRDLRSRINFSYAQRSLGTLGGGNHFIEVDKDEDGYLYIVVHSGSRYAGLEVANYYQGEAWKQVNGRSKGQLDALINEYKRLGRQGEIQEAVAALRAKDRDDISPELAYVQGYLFDDYIHDMDIMQEYATLNRQAIVDTIVEGLAIDTRDIVEQWTTRHNYIDTSSMILRKGAVSAVAGQKLIIPMNMRDGSLICIGRGNVDWNYSAPHGAGRVLSRNRARKTLDLDKFRKEMLSIYSSTVCKDTLDEAPEAYRKVEDIVREIGDTVDIVKRVKPIYNFKAVELRRKGRRNRR